MAFAHLIPTAAAAVAGFAVGGLWYGPLFGKAWMAEWGFTDADKARFDPRKLFTLTLLLDLVIAFFLGHLLAHVAHSAQTTMMISTGIGLGFVGPALVIDYLYSLRSVRLMAIDVGHWVATFAVMGGVFVLLGV
ncbi:MAG: DUF1761 domain-containing protein [Proteobacteria bacterium]|nr:DUF1761 domain-containing protein [Pseudomonadota bacterium]